MKSAAKRRNFFSAIIALALLFCASHVASANVLEISKTRAELKTDLGQNRVSESLFYSVKRGENYDRLEGIALESSVAPNRVGQSELGNALSGLGRNPLGRNINTLDEFGSGAGFSGVFDPASGKFLAYPSGTTRLANGGRPLNLVEQFGGHGDVNNALSDLLGNSTTNRLGFSAKLDDVGNFSVRFNSRTINSPNPNFPGRTVPQHLRQQILDAIESTTGRTATSAQ